MREAVIVAACRTAVGKAPRGMLKDTRPEHMGCAVLGDLLKRAGDLDPALKKAGIFILSGRCVSPQKGSTAGDRRHKKRQSP